MILFKERPLERGIETVVALTTPDAVDFKFKERPLERGIETIEAMSSSFKLFF